MIKFIFNFFHYSRTFNDWLDEYQLILNSRKLKKHTLQNKYSMIKILRQKFGSKSVKKISTLELAEIISAYVKRDTNTAAKFMYQILKDIFREAYFNGWIERNPTDPLRCPKTPVKRARLTFSEFESMLSKAKKRKKQYFYQALTLALVTGQRRSDITTMKRSDIKDGYLFIEQYKTGAKIALPLNLYCEKLDMTLEYVINHICTGSNYLIECNNGNQVQLFSLTQYFAKIRDEIFERASWDGTPPSFHEIRSLSERLYRAQGVDTMNLLGHKSQKMTDKYNDSRGREWRYLRI